MNQNKIEKIKSQNLDLVWAKNIIDLLEFASGSFDADLIFKRFGTKAKQYTNADKITYQRYERKHSPECIQVYPKEAKDKENYTHTYSGEVKYKEESVGKLSIFYIDSKPIEGIEKAFQIILKTLEIIVSRFYERNEVQASQVNTIISALANDFGNITYIDLVHGTERIVKANNAGVLVDDDKHQVSFSERVEHYVSDFIIPSEREEMAVALSLPVAIEKTKNGEPYIVSCRIKIAGKIHYRNVKYVPQVEDGKVIALVIGFQSTDSEHMYQEKLEVALKKAETANKAKTAFLFNMSHDIRTPMNAIMGFTTIAKKHLTNEQKTKDYLDKISSAGDQLLNLINKVLEMSRIESGKVILNKQLFNVVDRINASGIIFNELCAQKGLKLSISTENIKHKYIFSDPDRLDQILNNLLGNACKYTLEGGAVSLYMSQEEGSWLNSCVNTIIIKDTGIGMSEEYIEHIFDEFSRESNSTVSHIEGSGLGMSIVKKIIDILGGQIVVESTKGVGTTVTLTLETPFDDNAVTEKEKDIECNFSLKGMKILLAEDNELNREIAGEILEENGVIVETVNDGDDAVRKMAEANPEDFDAILMDIQMPKMNGYEATKAIRALPHGMNIPIIAISANAFEEDKQRSLTEGMDDHIAKPINTNELVRVLAKYMNNKNK